MTDVIKLINNRCFKCVIICFQLYKWKLFKLLEFEQFYLFLFIIIIKSKITFLGVNIL